MRTQIDGNQDNMSLAAGLTCDPAEDRARPEFADEADVNAMLRRYGVPVAGHIPYAEYDYSLDFQEAMQSILEARAAIGRLPQPFLKLYGGIEAATAAFMNGHLESDLRDWLEHQQTNAGDAGSSSAATGDASSQAPAGGAAA